MISAAARWLLNQPHEQHVIILLTSDRVKVSWSQLPISLLVHVCLPSCSPALHHTLSPVGSTCCLCVVLSGPPYFIDKNWQQVWCVQRSVGNIRISCWMFLCSVLCVGYWSRSRESRYCSERPATVITVLDFWLVTFWQIYVTIVEILRLLSSTVNIIYRAINTSYVTAGSEVLKLLDWSDPVDQNILWDKRLICWKLNSLMFCSCFQL